MKFIDKLEAKIGRYAIKNLMLYLVIIYSVGFIVNRYDPQFYINNLSLNMYEILHGQVWRLVTFLCYPPADDVLWCLLSVFVFYSLGKLLEGVLGSFRFNLYIFTGILGTIAAALIIYLVWDSVWLLSTDQLYLTMLLAIAVTIPDLKFFFLFFIPVKAKWLGIVYGGLLVIEIILMFIQGNYPMALEMFLSVINFVIFFFLYRKPAQAVKQKTRAKVYQMKARPANETVTGMKKYRHKCCVCGITDIDSPDMEFRYCSQCDGAKEYCANHIHNHTHIHNV